MTPLQIYLISRLDNVSAFFQVLTVILGITMVGLILIFIFALKEYYEKTDMEEQDKDERDKREEESLKQAIKRIKRFFLLNIFLFAFGLVGCIFTPTTKEVMAIYLIPKITNNEQVQKLPDNVLKFVNSWLENNTKKEVKNDD